MVSKNHGPSQAAAGGVTLSVDTNRRQAHSIHVVVLTRRIVVMALSVVLSSPGVGLCAGWAATAEARIACCAKDGGCAMHQSAEGSATAISQADADGCCAASERDQSTPSPTFPSSVSLALVVSPISVTVPSTVVPPHVWHAFVPLPGSQVPRHLLLSVFLV